MKRAAIAPGLAFAVCAASVSAQDPLPVPAPRTAPAAPPCSDLAQQLASERGAEAAQALLLRGKDAAKALAPFLEKPERWREDHRIQAQDLAIAVLGELGPDATDAAEAMLDAVDRAKGKQRNELVLALADVVPWSGEARKRLEERLGTSVRDRKVGVFGKELVVLLSRTTFDPAVPRARLIEGLQHENVFVRELAAEALARDLRRAPPPAEERERLLELLAVQWRAPQPQDVTVSLQPAGGGRMAMHGKWQRDEHVKAAIGLAIAALAPERPEVVPGLARELLCLSVPRRVEALRALGSHGEAAMPALPAMLAALDAPEPPVAREAATALGMLGNAAVEATPALLRAAASEDRQLAARAAAALKRIRP